MKRPKPSSFPDSRGKIAHILNPHTNECIAYSGVSHTTRSCLGYGVSFEDDKLPNLSGSFTRDKSGYRCELRAIFYALLEISRNVAAQQKRQTNYIIYSSHEYAVSRINGGQDIGSGAHGAGSAGNKLAESSTIGTTTNSEVNHTPCLDFLLQIRLLIQYITEKGDTARIVYIAQTTPGIAQANHLAREAISRAAASKRAEDQIQPSDQLLGAPAQQQQQQQVISPVPKPLSIYARVPSSQFQRVFTDGTSIANGTVVIAGYGVFFGICDPRNETGTVRGLGTGPRGALAGILRAITQISHAHRGHKKWEIVSCRGQYIKSIFELSEQWRRNGWRRSAGKAIASLDIYRAARKLLDDLERQGFEIKGTYIAQKQAHSGLMAADIMARRGAGDTSIEITDKITEDPIITVDDIEMKVWCHVEEYTTEQGPRCFWVAQFEGMDQPAQGAIAGSRDALGKALYTVSKVLRLVESKPERRWRIGVEDKPAADLLALSLDPAQSNPEDRKKRPTLLEPIFSNLQRLKRHGYEINFFYNDRPQHQHRPEPSKGEENLPSKQEEENDEATEPVN